MTSFPEQVERFLAELAATCPPGYELDEMHLENDVTSNATKVVVTWKPVVVCGSGSR